MKNKSLMLLVLILGLGISFLVYKNYNHNNQGKVTDNEWKTTVSESQIDNIMKNMTIDEKIGQMIIINTDYSSMTFEFKDFLNKIKPSGIILMKENFTDYENTKKFISDMKNFSKYPFIVSIDQEGGRVQRLQYLEEGIATNVPDMYTIGLTNDEKVAYNIGKLLAEEMRTIGINVDFAPVVDIYSNPDNTVIGNRSFGINANNVSKMAISLANGLEDNGIIATYKHFPGHGDTEVDSHKKLPVIYKSLEEVNNLELIPFKKAIENNAKIIMVGHMSFPLLTMDNTPSSLSKIIVTNILKGDLGFDGLIITDALNMGALTDNYSNEEIYLKAIEAGNDLLLMPKDPISAFNVIKENISEERINESVKKILMFKYTYLDKDNTLDRSYLGSEEHKKLIENIGL